MSVNPSMPKLALVAIALCALGLGGASPIKRGNNSAYVRFEIANPVTTHDMLDVHPRVPDTERMLETESARMIDGAVLEAAAQEPIVARDGQPLGLEELRAMLHAEVVPGTYFVDLVASATTESDALAVAEAAATVYLDRLHSYRGKIMRDQLQNLELAIRDLSKDIEQIDARCEALMAKEKLIRLSQRSEDLYSIEARLLIETIAKARMDRKMQGASGASVDEVAAQDRLLAELESQLQLITTRMESETQNLYQLQHWTSEHEEKVRMKSELLREMVRLRMAANSIGSVYPGIRRVSGPRIRDPREN